MYCCDIVLDHGVAMRPETVPMTAAQTLAYIYASRQNAEWKTHPAGQVYSEPADNMLSYMFNRWYKELQKLPPELSSQVINAIVAQTCRASTPSITFSEFATSIMDRGITELPEVPIPNMCSDKRGILE